ncbi:hypothetical protein Tco_0564518 [Tanacetum coccineum]
MALSIADQIALDDALVAPADRLKIGKCNLRLSSDITSKEATLQVVYDVLKLTPFYKAFQVTADAPEIYMQEFWASAYVHNRSVRFKMNNKKHIIGLEQFRDILQICPKVGNKKFVDPPLESEIIIFLASLGHTGDIRKLSDVNVNKLHQPWRSFAAVINKCLCGTPSYDSLRLSQAQILWGMYNKKNVDYAYLLWEDFIFKIETKSSKKGSAMYYPRFTKLVVNYVMEKDPSIPRRNKVNWHYARDDPMFSTINVISRNEATQLYGAILPVALTNEDIRNSESYKEYYAMASGTIPPKTKGSKKKANTDAIPKRSLPLAPEEKEVRKNDEQNQDDEDAEKHDVHETTQEDEDDDDHDDDENDQEDDDEHDDDKKAEDDDDEELTESDNDDDEDSDNDVEGANVAGAKSDEDATDEKDQGNEASTIQITALQGLVEAYEADKILLDTYGDTVTLKRPRDGADDDEEPSAGTDRGSKRRRSGKDPRFYQCTKRPGRPGVRNSFARMNKPTRGQHLPDWGFFFKNLTRQNHSPDHAWNTSVPAVHETVQPWLSSLAQQDPRESFDELTDSTFDFFLLPSRFLIRSSVGISHLGERSDDISMHLQTLMEITGSGRLISKKTDHMLSHKVENCRMAMISSILTDLHYGRDDEFSTSTKKGDFHRTRDPRH